MFVGPVVSPREVFRGLRLSEVVLLGAVSLLFPWSPHPFRLYFTTPEVGDSSLESFVNVHSAVGRRRGESEGLGVEETVGNLQSRGPRGGGRYV